MVDFDEVLWDLHQATNEWTKKNHNFSFTKRDCNCWTFTPDRFPEVLEEVYNTWDVYKTAGYIEGAEGFVKDLLERYGEDNVVCITSTMPNLLPHKDELIHALGIKHIIHAHKKHEHSGGYVLIDDAMHNVLEHVMAKNGHAIMVDMGYGWNQQPLENLYDTIHRANNYADILGLLKYIEKLGKGCQYE